MENLRVLKNEALKGIELYFDSKPDQTVINNLKENGFRWHHVKKCWYNKISDKVLALVNQLSNGLEIQTSPKENTTKKQKQAVNKYGVKVGDIFVMSWGYEQTNVNYFQVVETKGEYMVKIREIAYKIVEVETSMSSYVAPAKDNFLERSLWCNDKKLDANNNEGIWKKIKCYSQDNSNYFIDMSSYANAYPTKENRKNFTSSWA